MLPRQVVLNGIAAVLLPVLFIFALCWYFGNDPPRNIQQEAWGLHALLAASVGWKKVRVSVGGGGARQKGKNNNIAVNAEP